MLFLLLFFTISKSNNNDNQEEETQPILAEDPQSEETNQEQPPNNSSITIDMADRSFSSYCNKWWYFVTISFLIGSIGLIIISYLWETQHKDIEKFSVVFDAGSSHTQLYIYSWQGSKTNGTAVVEQVASFKSNETGIQHFSGKPSEIPSILQPYLNFAMINIPSNQYASSPIYLGATAGMRLLRQVNQSAADVILTTIRETFKKSGFQFTKPELQVRILNGSEEGSFSWISANYLSGKLAMHPISEMLYATQDLTIGALDLGGASTQITFVPKTSTKIPSNFSLEFPLYGQSIKVYTHSFLCYGINEMIRKYKAKLVMNHQEKSEVIESPCWLKNSSHNDFASDIFKAPCTNRPEKSNLQEYHFIGTGNSKECQRNIESLFDFNKCSYNRCSFNNVFQPSIENITFLAFSGYYWTMKDLNLTQTEDTLTFEKFTSVINSWCNKTWDEAILVPGLSNPVKKRLCVQAIYIKTLLSKGFHFDSNDWNQLHFNNSASGSNLGWALGFMIYTSNSIASVIPKNTFSVTTYILLGILFVIFILLAIGFAVVAKKEHKETSFYVPAPNYGSNDRV